ncbi:ROK family protein [Thermanaerovibrio acidaminovorans]|uniref:ROK family protein n=1 Tax=Thermanaerovibrio acidaminovorans (strain ATCC 49978 / DSM 6589 / Su883) TaxID=525903 RepID=D1B918_THEAS|nr:ROK family protein [Thermanaerovibrio acidaminovorans]ACZ18771.1 ROK family protein [Thermanaerovibrio acidaminovorans DSM 6589]
MECSLRIAVDVGGHTVTVGLVDAGSFQVLGHVSHPTPEGGSVAPLARLIRREASRLCGDAGVSIPDQVRMAVPGMLSRERDRILKAPNVPGLDGVWLRQVRSALEGEMGGPVRVLWENDANCYALGEWARGVARGMGDLVLFTLGTGIGCGIILGGRLLIGSRGMAGEAGHLVVRDGGRCGCGGVGHLEAHSGTGAVEALGGGDFRSLWEEFRAGVSRTEVESFLDGLARGMASVFHLLDPQAVVLGGGASRAEGLLEELLPRMGAYLAEPFRGSVRVLISQLGDLAPLIGAAALG